MSEKKFLVWLNSIKSTTFNWIRSINFLREDRKDCRLDSRYASWLIILHFPDWVSVTSIMALSSLMLPSCSSRRSFNRWWVSHIHLLSPIFLPFSYLYQPRQEVFLLRYGIKPKSERAWKSFKSQYQIAFFPMSLVLFHIWAPCMSDSQALSWKNHGLPSSSSPLCSKEGVNDGKKMRILCKSIKS